jgi:AraC-like DNA-binding protein
MALVSATDDASYVRAPVGKWRRAGSSIAWCHSAALTGCMTWGRQTADETRAVMGLFESFAQLAPQFDMILDGSSIDRIEAGALLVFADWMRRHSDILRGRVRRHIGVNAPGVGAFMLAGIFPLIIGSRWQVTRVLDRREAFRLLLPNDEADALCNELVALMDQVRGTPPIISRLRDVLASCAGRISATEAARALGLSLRSLQRELSHAGFSYREEQHAAQFRRAEQLLPEVDKIAIVAARLGMSERALDALVRARTGLTPAELRERLRRDS